MTGDSLRNPAMTKIIRDAVSEYESAVFDSTKGLLEDFNKCSVKDAIILLNKWLSITVADTSGSKAIGWKMPENDVCGETEGSSSFDPVFRCEVAYKLPNDEEKNLWVRVAPNVKALFETFLGEYYWGYGNILHFNAILGKYIHMCVDIDVCAMRVNGKDLKVGNKYAQYINGFPIFPVDVIENGIPLSQAFLGSESDVVFINWFKDEGKREGFEKICKGVSKGVMNVNFVFPDVGDVPLPFNYGLERFKEKNDGFENDFPAVAKSSLSVAAILGSHRARLLDKHREAISGIRRDF